MATSRHATRDPQVSAYRCHESNAKYFYTGNTEARALGIMLTNLCHLKIVWPVLRRFWIFNIRNLSLARLMTSVQANVNVKVMDIFVVRLGIPK